MHEYPPSPGTPFADAVAAIAEPTTPPDDVRVIAFAAAAEQAIEVASGRRHRRRLVATLIAVPAFVVAGSGVAYAATTIDWSAYWDKTTTQWTGWAEDPDAVVSYTLPSGRSCELRFGEFAFSPADDRPSDVVADARVLPAAVDFARSSMMITDADVQKVISANRSDHNWAIGDDGTSMPSGHGTENDDADVEYDGAVAEAVHDAIEAHLAAVGLPSAGLSYVSQQQCTDIAP